MASSNRKLTTLFPNLSGASTKTKLIQLLDEAGNLYHHEKIASDVIPTHSAILQILESRLAWAKTVIIDKSLSEADLSTRMKIARAYLDALAITLQTSDETLQSELNLNIVYALLNVALVPAIRAGKMLRQYQSMLQDKIFPNLEMVESKLGYETHNQIQTHLKAISERSLEIVKREILPQYDNSFETMLTMLTYQDETGTTKFNYFGCPSHLTSTQKLAVTMGIILKDLTLSTSLENLLDEFTLHLKSYDLLGGKGEYSRNVFEKK